MNGSATELPALHEFLISPGFITVGVIVASVVGFTAAWYLARQKGFRLDTALAEQDRHWVEQQRAEAVKRCWDRLAWLIDNAGDEPAGGGSDDAKLGMGPELAVEVLSGIHAQAGELGDETLARAAAAYLAQYGLVLGQQTAPLPAPAARPGPPAKPARAESQVEKPLRDGPAKPELAEKPTRRSRRA